jgi:hypothetical protein
MRIQRLIAMFTGDLFEANGSRTVQARTTKASASSVAAITIRAIFGETRSSHRIRFSGFSFYYSGHLVLAEFDLHWKLDYAGLVTESITFFAPSRPSLTRSTSLPALAAASSTTSRAFFTPVLV